MKSINTEKDGYCIDIITDSEESVLKSIPSVCEKRKWQFVVLEGLWRVRIAKLVVNLQLTPTRVQISDI